MLDAPKDEVEKTLRTASRIAQQFGLGLCEVCRAFTDPFGEPG